MYIGAWINDSSCSAMIKLAIRICKPYLEQCRKLLLCWDMMPQDSSLSIAAAKRHALRMIQKEYGIIGLVQRV